MLERLRRSLLLHLSLAFAAGFLVLLGGALFYLKTAMIRTVYTQVDKDLLDATRVTLHRLEEDHYPLNKELLDLGDNLYLRVVDPSGRTVLESVQMPRIAPLRLFPVPGQSWTWAESPRHGEVRTKLVSVRYSGGWIQVARDMHPDEVVLTQFRRLLRWAIAVTPFLGAMMGYLLVQAGLKPLRTLVQGAQSVGPENLGYRIDTAALPLELDPLGRELNRTFQRLEEGFERLSALNGDLAHELRTPLHSLRLEMERLLDRGGLPQDLEESLGEMTETGAHMAELIDQMLLLARVEDPSRHLEARTIDVGQLLEQARAPFLALADEQEVRIVLQLGGKPGLVGDPVLLRRALHNLLANALRHSPSGTSITLKARGDAHGTVLEVADQGPGVPAMVKERLGQRFLRMEQARDKRSGGTGLGLAIVQGIAKLHGAHLALADASPTGCRAMITFP